MRSQAVWALLCAASMRKCCQPRLALPHRQPRNRQLYLGLRPGHVIVVIVPHQNRHRAAVAAGER